jgi:predicted XRE-type DNA-binding protein
MKTTKRRSSAVKASSGNVFADLQLPDARERQTKVRLAVALHRAITSSALTQASVAEKLGISQPKVSALLRYQLQGFSIERLMNFLIAFGNDVDIVVHKARGSSRGRIHVTAA